MNAFRIDEPKPTEDETTMAMLAHVLSVFGGGFIGPLVILISKRDSQFVKFHALSALIGHVIWMGFSMLLGVGMFATMIATDFGHAGHGRHAGPPPLFFAFMPIFFLNFAAYAIVAIVLAVRAKGGRWSALPGIEALARKLMGSV